MSQDLFKKIAEIDQQVADDLRDGGLTDDDIKDLCFEALKEIIPTPGLKGVVLRSRIWKIISKENTPEEVNVNSSLDSIVGRKRKLDDTVIDNFYESSGTDESPQSPMFATKSSPHSCRVFYSNKPPCSPIFSTKAPQSSICSTTHTKTGPMTSHAKSPEYTIYKDKVIEAAVQSGNMPKELRHRLIRGTIHNMISVAFNAPYNRMPTTNEVMEMAKSLVIAYPPLCDDCDPATGHGALFKQLKKRLYNQKPVETKHAPKEKKPVMKNVKDLLRDKVQTNDPSMSGNGEDDSHTDAGCIETDNESGSSGQSKEVMERHYSALSKEMAKNKPSPVVINMYLNKEFEARRSRIRCMPAEQRCEKLLEAYPCFKNHVEMIEEVRRVLGKAAEHSDPESFMRECLEHFDEEYENMIYFGVSRQRIGHPPKHNKIAKVVHLMKNLPLIFCGGSSKAVRQTKKTIDLLYVIKEHEDPEECCSRKQNGKVPMLFIDSTSAYLVCQGRICSTIRKEKLPEAVLALIGMFYLLDIDYNKHHELGLTMMQNLFFGDKSTPGDLINIFNSMLADFTKFKNID